MEIPAGCAEGVEEVVAWRCDQLAGAGFPLLVAVRLAADSRYDLHELVALVERGCPSDLAIRILAPLDEDVQA